MESAQVWDVAFDTWENAKNKKLLLKFYCRCRIKQFRFTKWILRNGRQSTPAKTFTQAKRELNASVEWHRRGDCMSSGLPDSESRSSNLGMASADDLPLVSDTAAPAAASVTEAGDEASRRMDLQC